ncbi:hypothetical protein ABTN73_19945, partial [Acinetobacter baumannii]
PQLHVYQVQNRPAAELAGILQSMFAQEMKVVVRSSGKNVAPRSKQTSFGSDAGKTSGNGVGMTDANSQTGFGRSGDPSLSRTSAS